MIRTAILGTGAVARMHIDGYTSFPDRCEIAALCDMYPEKAEELAAEEGLKDAAVYKDYHDILVRKDIDAVSICLPPSVHAETAVECLRSGKHVLLEKPMASSLEECDAVLKAQEDSGRLLSVVSQNRFQTPVMRIKHLIDTNAAGKMLHASVNSYWWRGENYYDLWWRGTWKQEGGGCTLNHAVHHIDLLRWMLGTPREVYAFFTNLNHGNSETEDYSTAIFSYSDGSAAQLNASLVHHGEDQEMVFQCERARISVPWKVSACRTTENGFPSDDPETVRELQDLYEAAGTIPFAGHKAQIDDFLDAVTNNRAPLVTGRDGRDTLELVMAIYKSGLLKAPVSLPLNPGDPFYKKDTMTALMPHFHEKTRVQENFSSSDITFGRDMSR